MNNKLPFDKKFIEEISKKYPTPFYLYDEKGLRETAKNLYKAFSWSPGFKNFEAIKTNPNPYILKILKEVGMGADASSLTELMLAEKVGFKGEEIMFSSNNTPYQEYQKASELGAIINLDDITHIEYVEKHLGKLPNLISFRYNPGPRRTGNAIIGDPKEAKYGLTYEQIFEAYKIAKSKGVKRFGLHTMVVSNELEANAHIETANMMFTLAVSISKEVGIEFEFINLGGGYGIPHRPTDMAIDVDRVSEEIKKLYEKSFQGLNSKPLVCLELGRFVVGSNGYLITKVRHFKHTYKEYAGLDASMADFMRPALYGAYHHISIMGKEDESLDHTYDVVGSLCENNDKFAIDRKLPKLDIGDIAVIQDVGGHGRAMGFNYNGKLRPAELLLRENGQVVQIRRAETVDDYFATLDFEGLSDFK